MNYKNILERALWTFLEGFLGAFMLPTTLVDCNAWKAAIFAAALAGISAVKTFIVELLAQKEGADE